jgi:hypothetical protein
MIKRDDTTKEYLGIVCDKCEDPAPPAKEIMAAHGLVRLGWYCSGGNHICPKCEHPK